MRKKILVLTLSISLAVFFGINSAHALLIVSGDTNITNPLNNTNGWGGLDSGNQQFFTNVLQGGTTVKVLGSSWTGSVGYSDTDVDDYYNTLTGVTSAIHTGTVDATTLAGVDLFVAPLPDHSFSAAEISVFSNYLNSGGSLFITGENNNFTTTNANINTLLAGIGSGLSIINDVFDSSFHTATGSQIATDSLTTGVNTFTYAAPSAVSTVSGGTALFFGTQGQTFLAYEATSVPEPSTLLLLGTGLIGLAGFRRKFKV